MVSKMYIYFFDEIGYTIKAVENVLVYKNINFHKYNNIIYVVREDEPFQRLELNKIYFIDGVKLIVINDTSMKYKYSNNVLFAQNGDVKISGNSLLLAKDKILRTDHDIYVNGIRRDEQVIKLNNGDEVVIDDTILSINLQDKIISIKTDNSSDLELIGKVDFKTKDFPIYYRSPRVIKTIPNDEVIIDKPREKEGFSRDSLVMIILPPVVSALATILLAVFMGRSMIMLIGVLTTVVTTILSIYRYFRDKKRIKERNELRIKNYNNYLRVKSEEIKEIHDKMHEALIYNFPNINKVVEYIQEYNPRIYERELTSDDFLSVVIGNYENDVTYKLKFEQEPLNLDEDDLEDEALVLYNQYSKLKDFPLSIEIREFNYGIVGENKLVCEQLQNILWQLVCFHSYHDLKITLLYNEKEEEFFNCFSYLEHFYNKEYNTINCSSNFSDSLSILNSFYNQLKERKQVYDDSGGKTVFSTHLLLVITSIDMIINHSIMLLLKEANKLNCSIIICTQDYTSLPEFVKTIDIIENRDKALLLLNKGEEVSIVHRLYYLPEIDTTWLARNLSQIEHKLVRTAIIPSKYDFLEMYNVKRIEDLNIAERYNKSNPTKSLAVPLGIKAESEMVYLDLHESFHGPHGLIAGTTGSGKSELIQSYILSLAVNFSPEDVGFLLIDFKGGGMSKLFENLPHVLGTITNLDGDNINRNLESVKAEVQRRQIIFANHDVNNINSYTTKYKNGEAKEPLPHLFMISDEFAELKKEHPDFMKELVSIARIGRTLGIHLILATQKPSGIVDDQIWSNSRFKISLKVQTESDSKEILKTPDAAFITNPGRAYLQIGNNEIYDLFQSAYSGADYESKDNEKIYYPIYRLNRLGQGQIINPIQEENSKEVESQLDAIIDYIARVEMNRSHPKIKKTWLPSLETNICSPHININEILDVSDIKFLDLDVHLGMVDIPDQQKQEELVLNTQDNGNILFLASSGYGKTVSLSTFILSLAVKNNPELLQFYILDFGNVGLISLSKLPHVRDYIRFEEDEKISKFVNIINEEMQHRKDLIAMEFVSDINKYNELHPENIIPQLYIIIDNMDVISELFYGFDDFLIKLTRDAQSLGINLISSANKQGSFRYALLNNFKTRIEQYMFNDDSVNFGKSSYKLDRDTKGRALVSLAKTQMMQIYTPVYNDERYVDNLLSLVSKINEEYTGVELDGIPMIPNMFGYLDINKYKSMDDSPIKLGLEYNNVKLVGLPELFAPFIILGPSNSGKTNMIKLLYKQTDGIKYVFDSPKMEMIEEIDDTTIYVSDMESYLEAKSQLSSLLNERKEYLKQCMMKGDRKNPKSILSELDNVSIFIDNYDALLTSYSDEICEIINDLLNYNIKVIIAKNNNAIVGIDALTNRMKLGEQGVLLGNNGNSGIFDVIEKESPTFTNGILFNMGTKTSIKIPRA